MASGGVITPEELAAEVVEELVSECLDLAAVSVSVFCEGVIERLIAECLSGDRTMADVVAEEVAGELIVECLEAAVESATATPPPLVAASEDATEGMYSTAVQYSRTFGQNYRVDIFSRSAARCRSQSPKTSCPQLRRSAWRC